VLSRRRFLRGAGGSLAAIHLQKLLGERVPVAGPATHFWLGTAYYPELTPHEQWRADFAHMRSLGINVVRLAEYAWSTLQPSESRFEFGWLDEAISLAAQQRISVLLGVPTASVPPWLYRLHPDALAGDEHGPYTYGGRKGFSVHSAAMKAASLRVIHAMASRYAANPAVVGWQLSNEPGFPFTQYDPAGLRAFQQWLRSRYKTLDAFNEAWGGAFWSNSYDSWDEVMFPSNPAEIGFKPAVRLDYRRFFSDSYLEWLRFEAQTLRSGGAQQMAFVNWPEITWSVDIFATDPFLDVGAWDNYGSMADDRDFHTQFYSSLNHDFCRCSSRGKRFFVAEQRSQAPASSSPGAVRLQTFADFAYGAFGTVFFEWRPPVSGAERGYASILEPDGSDGASVVEIEQMGREFDTLWPKLREAKTIAKVAMVFSYSNQWDRGFGETTDDAKLYSYVANFERFYAGAKALGTNIDIVAPTSSLEGYDLVIAPGLQMVSDEDAARLVAFVERGGCLVLDQGAGKQPAGSTARFRGTSCAWPTKRKAMRPCATWRASFWAARRSLRSSIAPKRVA
jgi:beta-galactosidase